MQKALIFTLVLSLLGVAHSRSFTVDYKQGTFLKDGKPFKYVSGSIHYARVHPDSWHDRLYKMKFAGLDAIEVYVPWNFHEPEQGQFDFTEWRDVEKFIQMAADLDLLVIFRPGPYICAEWEFGGFPYWILKNNASIDVRTSDPAYLSFVDSWYSQLIPRMRHLLYINGGPIISVQIENEYGTYFKNDDVYKQHLWSTLKKYLVDDVVYFTTDASNVKNLMKGNVNRTLSTVDFGLEAGSVKHGYSTLKRFNSSFVGPYVNSEFYIGWLDLWGHKHSTVGSTIAAKTLEDFFTLNGNVNMYMFHGGTNFGFSTGAVSDTPYQPVPTSYDYDAAISEAGDLTYKYWLLRGVIQKYKPLPEMPTPVNSTKAAYGKLNVTLQGPLHICQPIISQLKGYPMYIDTYPKRMELMDTGYGYVLYRNEIIQDYKNMTLSVPGLRDRGYVLLNNVYLGVLDRNGPTNMTITAKRSDSLNILVENQGRVGFGSGLTRGTKGIISNVTINGTILIEWSMFNIRSNLEDLQICQNHFKSLLLKKSIEYPIKFAPSTYLGILNVTKPADTFIRTDGWSKGHIEVNSFNIGRYWPSRGPQQTLYIPAALIKTGKNIITITELESAPCRDLEPCVVEFVDTPDLSGGKSVDATFQWQKSGPHAGHLDN